MSGSLLVERVAAATHFDEQTAVIAVDAMRDAVIISDDVKLLQRAKSATSTNKR
jgi:hypothetical protein